MCGLSGILSVTTRPEHDGTIPTTDARFQGLADTVTTLEQRGFAACGGDSAEGGLAGAGYLGGLDTLDRFREDLRALRRGVHLPAFLSDPDRCEALADLSGRLHRIIEIEARELADRMGGLAPEDVETMSEAIDRLRDAAWCIDHEILENLDKIRYLTGDGDTVDPLPAPRTLAAYRDLNAVFNALDRLEVRGRDSAGISLLFVLDRADYEAFRKETADAGEGLDDRIDRPVLLNRDITVHETADGDGVAVGLTYKVAAEIGGLGDNVAFLREQVRADPAARTLFGRPFRHHSVSAHTRWASVGAISEPNCHPVDNRVVPREGGIPPDTPIIHVCLNGDIDNYLDLRRSVEAKGDRIPEEISTDTKIIPLRIESYIKNGFSVAEAFRLAVNDFDGSHAVSMHTDLAPGKLFLAQKGSGQAIFVGLAEDAYVTASEVYGFVEETSRYLKLDGEKVVEGETGPTQGQIFILDADSEGGLSGVTARYYDGTPITLTEADIKTTRITSRDIDRQGHPHYFLKEISESPISVEKTLLNRWKVAPTADGTLRHVVTLDDTVIPEVVRRALDGSGPADEAIRRIFFVGQGTAGVAAQACADLLEHYMSDPSLVISSLKASEMSGFRLGEDGDDRSMADALVIAISQSGTTADTNRTVDLVRARGGKTLAIVNRRDSDLTFKVDGVMYTSSGRDVEMSVASTKAFYGQIVAGAILGLYLAGLRGRRSDAFIAGEIRRLLDLPDRMRAVLARAPEIEAGARRFAITRTYWAVVGSGPNKTAADEIRIKLSELCYKTISSDYVEDKKHIDLSSEPLIIVCAAGTRPTVIGDIIKDVAIFRAHKAIPIVITDEGETRFDPYAAAVFRVPQVAEHLAPILNTLVGHIWGYYAALAIHEGSRFLFEFRREIQSEADAFAAEGMDVNEMVLEKSFRETVARFYTDFRKMRAESRLPLSIGTEYLADLTILLKYLAGRLPVSDFELDFNVKGTALNMINTLFASLGEAINIMSRPVDAIKHQAKTVTVGTSRISEQVEGRLFDALAGPGFKPAQLIPSNVNVLRNLQAVVAEVLGMTLYRIRGLDILGEPTDETTIDVVDKTGTSADLPSRVRTDNQLKGSKRTIVRQGNIYIGKGRKDDRSILVIPILSDEPDRHNTIEHLMLLHIAFKDEVPMTARIKALGGKYEHIINIVQEKDIAWEDRLLDKIAIPDLFGRSAEKVGEMIADRVAG